MTAGKNAELERTWMGNVAGADRGQEADPRVERLQGV